MFYKGDTGTKYKDRIRSRVFNLKDKKNPELKTRVIKGMNSVLSFQISLIKLQIIEIDLKL